MTLYADPHRRYQEILNIGQRKLLTSRRSPVEKNRHVVVKLSERAVALSEIQNQPASGFRLGFDASAFSCVIIVSGLIWGVAETISLFLGFLAK